MIRAELTGYIADTVFRSLKVEQVLAFDIERMDLGGLFVSKETGLYALYILLEGSEGSASRLSLCGLESKDEYADLVEEVSGLIRTFNPVPTENEDSTHGEN